MSNETKLKPVERSLYRRVFMARIESGQSPEAAHRHGLNAVKMWNEVGAFNEGTDAPTDEEALRLAKGFLSVADFHNDEDALFRPTEDYDYRDLINDYLGKRIDLAEFRRRLGLDRDSSG